MSTTKDHQLVHSPEIAHASLHVPLELSHRLYCWPFVILYLAYGFLVYWHYYIFNSSTWIHASLRANYEFYLIPMLVLALGHFLTVMSCFWSVKCRAFLTCRRVLDPREATLICIIPVEHRGTAALVPLLHDAKGDNGDVCLSFRFQQCKFSWDGTQFLQAHYPDDLTVGDYQGHTGLNSNSISSLQTAFGLNEFTIHKPTFWELFQEHAVAPFFVFQVGCVGLWCLDEYWYYSVFTLFMLIIFESTVVYQRLRNIDEFRTMSVVPIPILVLRDDMWRSVASNELLPGDICSFDFKGDQEVTIPADMLILRGATCIVNEAMISGESTPLMKEPLAHEGNPRRFLDLDDGPDRAHLLFSGTKILQITPVTNDEKKKKVSNPPSDDAHLVAYVLRTGFGTLQGKLVRTMMFSSEQVSANNAESFAFIGVLLIFAVAAATYVLIKGSEDPSRSRYKLLLECALIITAVVPPELPMELTMAVNTALMALSQFAIYCMEPFRIPLAGKLDICCFDKTGTLTSENLDLEGMAGIAPGDPLLITKEAIPKEAALVAATCHSLFKVKSAVAGDPMERVTLEFVHGTLLGNDGVSLDGSTIKIVHRHPFSSALKRMSCVATVGGVTFVAAKGAPEVMQGYFSSVPAWYSNTFTKLAHDGARVLALGYKTAPKNLITASREHVESGLSFVGFLVFRCPLKKDSKAAVRMLRESAHQITIITGDNALTAIYTAKELDLVRKPVVLIESAASCKEVESGKAIALEAAITASHDLCMLGEAVEELFEADNALLSQLLPRTLIFARASPHQKELVLTTLKSMGLFTLMCGDGTNDVGALKQAHVGVALLDGKPEDLTKILREMRLQTARKAKQAIEDAKRRLGGESRQPPSASSLLESVISQQDEEGGKVRLGDASVAAPFTSKVSSVHAVCSIIRQGRCTLVTTIQMYKILALNSLISAYSLSVLHLKGIRYGDFQMTITGMLLAACFLFLSRGQPIKKMAPERPQSNIFNAYLLLSVLGQIVLHIGTMVYVLSAADYHKNELAETVAKNLGESTKEIKFAPSLVNTSVYLLSLMTQVSTFVVNYQGRPFRESLFENRPLRNALAIVTGICLLAATQWSPDFNTWMQLVAMPEPFQQKLLMAMVVDIGGCLGVEWLAYRLFFDSRPRLMRH